VNSESRSRCSFESSLRVEFPVSFSRVSRVSRDQRSIPDHRIQRERNRQFRRENVRLTRVLRCRKTPSLLCYCCCCRANRCGSFPRSVSDDERSPLRKPAYIETYISRTRFQTLNVTIAGDSTGESEESANKSLKSSARSVRARSETKLKEYRGVPLVSSGVSGIMPRPSTR